MGERAQGTFIVDQWEPETPYDQHEGVELGHTVIRKVFDGDLVGTSEVHMTSAVVPATGTAAYVAFERVHGTLHGRKGSFVLQHHATANGDEGSLDIVVVPNTGTGDLVGLTGTLEITKTGDDHTWSLDYRLP
ncbi:DUF3224 domain-containing protein [Actinokineospora auranticolor]|uniref:Uncharacterized protein DUF3224 n=1 Tax=Actinokineospora auranticolor TaxID=155976 RepID=A0A2S6GV52_9PSEU|nr:DUF3224 domain-containing protein [Actinokineospora auranticolor]PPK69090.1 uncharacterized protein DUF3224 [Actinokineospora auranticolor]